MTGFQVYTASYWWRDCDPNGGIVALSPQVAEDIIMDAMKNEQEDHECYCEDWEGSEHECEEAENLVWSGVFSDSLLTIIRTLSKPDRLCLLDDLRSQGYGWIS